MLSIRCPETPKSVRSGLMLWDWAVPEQGAVLSSITSNGSISLLIPLLIIMIKLMVSSQQLEVAKVTIMRNLDRSGALHAPPGTKVSFVECANLGSTKQSFQMWAAKFAKACHLTQSVTISKMVRLHQCAPINAMIRSET